MSLGYGSDKVFISPTRPRFKRELENMRPIETHGSATQRFDDYTGGEIITDMAGGQTWDVTFSSAVHMVVVTVTGSSGNGRADPFGGAADSSSGIVCVEGAPTYITVTTTTLSVWAPGGNNIHVYGVRR